MRQSSRAQVSVSDQEQRDHYEKNKANYNVSEKRQAKYVFLDFMKMGSQVDVTDEAISQYYEQNKAQYQLPGRVRAQHILFKTQGKTPTEIEAIRQQARMVIDQAKDRRRFRRSGQKVFGGLQRIQRRRSWVV